MQAQTFVILHLFLPQNLAYWVLDAGVEESEQQN
jgi:hypothetical protein